MHVSNTPWPPPASTILLNFPKSYASAIAGPVFRDRSVIALLKTLQGVQRVRHIRQQKQQEQSSPEHGAIPTPARSRHFVSPFATPVLDPTRRIILPALYTQLVPLCWRLLLKGVGLILIV